jgi:hypothetical protein
MNYASAFLALIFAFAGIYWFVHGRKFYTGPLIEAVAEDDADDQTSNGHLEKDADLRV